MLRVMEPSQMITLLTQKVLVLKLLVNTLMLKGWKHGRSDNNHTPKENKLVHLLLALMQKDKIP